MPVIVLSCTSIITIYWTDDDYATWTSGRTIELQQTGDVQLTRLGKSRKRAFKIEHVGGDNARFEALELEVDIGNFGF